MSYGPFQTKEGGDTIGKFSKEDLLPLTAKIEELAIDVSQIRHSFINSFFRIGFSLIEDKYKKISVEFIKVYHKWNTPDILFEDLKIDSEDKRKLGGLMTDYFQSQQAVMWHFNDGFRLLSYIDRIITEQSTASYNRISIALAILAITISVIIMIFK